MPRSELTIMPAKAIMLMWRACMSRFSPPVGTISPARASGALRSWGLLPEASVCFSASSIMCNEYHQWSWSAFGLQELERRCIPVATRVTAWGASLYLSFFFPIIEE